MGKYCSYNSSIVFWLDEIPSGWSITKNKFVLREQKKVVDENWKEYKLLSLTKKGVIERDLENSKGKFPEFFNTYKVVNKNDLIFCLYDIQETPRTIGLSDLNGMITGSYNIFQTNQNSKFVYYWFLMIDDVKGLKPYYTGMRNVVRNETFLSIKILLPPLQEQELIVKYLDDKTSIIDKLLSTKERKIELLKEQRTSLINEVITKGLNPSVKMKDSEVDWIGVIPENWEIKKMKYCLKLISDKRKVLKEDIKISPENVENGTGVCFNFYSDYTGEGMKFIKGDILLNKLRIYLKKILITENEGFSMGEMIVLRTIDGVNKYYFYTLFNQGLIDLLNNQSTGVKLPRVSPETILNTKIIYPPIKEQMEIVEYIDLHSKEIDNLIQLEHKKIEFLKEYRQSLISEVITGKMKVV
jgi:type I restriction enzyme S subunit